MQGWRALSIRFFVSIRGNAIVLVPAGASLPKMLELPFKKAPGKCIDLLITMPSGYDTLTCLHSIFYFQLFALQYCHHLA